MAIFGINTSGGATQLAGNNTIILTKYSLTENGLVSKLTAWTRSGDWPRNLKGVIYSDDAGYPGSLLAVSNPVGLSSPPSWHNCTFPTPVDLSAGAYWLGYVADKSINAYYEGGDANQETYKFIAGSYASPPTPFPGGGTQEARRFKVYGTYEPTANPYPIDWLKKKVISGYHCFMGGYLNAKRKGLDPLKLPDGTLW